MRDRNRAGRAFTEARSLGPQFASRVTATGRVASSPGKSSRAHTLLRGAGMRPGGCACCCTDSQSICSLTRRAKRLPSYGCSATVAAGVWAMRAQGHKAEAVRWQGIGLRTWVWCSSSMDRHLRSCALRPGRPMRLLFLFLCSHDCVTFSWPRHLCLGICFDAHE